MPSVSAVNIGPPMLHNHLALHDGFTERLEIFKESRALSDIREHLTEQGFHTVSSSVLTAAGNAVWVRITGSLPHARKQFTLNLQHTRVCISVISHPAPSSRIGFYIRDKPPCIFGSQQFVYPWQAILHLRGTPVCISVMSHPAPSSQTSLYIRDRPPCIFESHQFVNRDEPSYSFEDSP